EYISRWGWSGKSVIGWERWYPWGHFAYREGRGYEGKIEQEFYAVLEGKSPQTARIDRVTRFASTGSNVYIEFFDSQKTKKHLYVGDKGIRNIETSELPEEVKRDFETGKGNLVTDVSAMQPLLKSRISQVEELLVRREMSFPPVNKNLQKDEVLKQLASHVM